MKISVILAFYNEEKYLKPCLDSIIKQTAKIYELIIVDDGSTDNSLLIAKKFKYYWSGASVKILTQRHQGAAIARNIGARKATGNILIFLDADMTYDRHFIKELIKPIIIGVEVATSTRVEFVKNLGNRWAKYWDEITFGNQGKRIIKSQGIRDGTFRAIKKPAFIKAAGYDSYGSQDDTSVLTKLGTTARCIDTAICYHNNPETLADVFFSVRWMGRNTENKKNINKLLVFFPLVSGIKSLIRGMKRRDFYYFIFLLVFEFGYFIGLVDVNIFGIHHK